MHYCDQVTLLRLARCNRMTMTAASHSFAWKSLSPIDFFCHRPRPLVARLSVSLLRFADLTMCWQMQTIKKVSQHIAAIVSLSRLRSLRMAGDAFFMRDGSVTLLADGFRNTRSLLQSLTLRSMIIRDSGAKALAAFIQSSSSTLTSLCVGQGVDITASALTIIATAIGSSAILRTFCIDSEMLFMDVSASSVAFSNILINSSSLTTIELKSCEIGSTEALALSLGVRQSNSLKHLLVSGNKIGAKGAEALTTAASHSHTLTTIAFDCCEIGDIGVVSLLVILQQCSSLTELDLSHNRISHTSMQTLVHLLQYNPSLTSLKLSNNPLGVAGIITLCSALQSTSTLSHLWLDDTYDGDSDAVLAISAAIDRGWNPAVLDISCRGGRGPVDETGMVALITSLSTRGHTLALESLALCGLCISYDYVRALHRATLHMSALRKLDLRNCIKLHDYEKCKALFSTLRVTHRDLHFKW